MDKNIALSSITHIMSCEGSASRILKDLDKYDLDQFKIAYENDKDHGENSYKNIIKLGEVLKTLSK